MRTKVLALTAAISAIGAAAMADVYSVNVVGFVNKSLPGGYSFLSVPLKATNDTVATIFPSVPNGSFVLTWDAARQTYNNAVTYDTDIFGGWEDPALTLADGQGFFLNLPTAGAPHTITFVGEVRQGDALTTQLARGYTMAGSQVPQSGGIQTVLGYVPSNGDFVLAWNGTAQTWKNAITYDTDIFGGWEVEPVLDIAEGVFMNRGTAGQWTRNFHVQ